MKSLVGCFNLRCLAVALGWLICQGQAQSANVGVDIVNFSFQPSSVTVNAGDTVTWTQRDTGTEHNAVSSTGLWSEPLLAAGQTFSHQFTTAGNFPYHCMLHSFMTGSVTVQAVAVNQPPTVSITSPSNGATLASGPVTLVASASDPNGTVTQVQFFDGRNALGTATSAPYQITVTLSAGAHNLSAQATDNHGLVGGSGVVAITISAPAAPPTVSITSPSDGASFTMPASVTLQASASASSGSISQVEFFADSTSLGTVNSSPFSLTVNTLTPGSYALTAKATDSSGASTVSNPVHITINPAPTAPSLLNASFAGGQFQFTVGATTGQKYLIQASPDLINWTQIQAVTASGSSLPITDTPPAGTAHRFYRVQLQQ